MKLTADFYLANQVNGRYFRGEKIGFETIFLDHIIQRILVGDGPATGIATRRINPPKHKSQETIFENQVSFGLFPNETYLRIVSVSPYEPKQWQLSVTSDLVKKITSAGKADQTIRNGEIKDKLLLEDNLSYVLEGPSIQMWLDLNYA
ncbi:MAG: hypothetical protein MAG795_00577 [Candidatus Woesearchaeota archaeon]|nr:hypothetical protein [Candidatus Woesearchaeota archaeon]